MNKIKDFTDGERSKYGKLFSDLTFKISETQEMVSDKELNSRCYYDNLPVLQDYLEKVNEADRKAEGTGLFERFKSDEVYKDEVIAHRRRIQDKLDSLERCNSCKCSSCNFECPFKQCRNCINGTKVVGCDLERYVVTTGYKNVTLYNNDTEEYVTFEVVGMLYDLEEDYKYIYLCEVGNSENQHILGYVKQLNGEVEYEGLEEDILDEVYEIFNKFNCYR